ncbi:unnamed protein product, partial [Staurois parvus]
YLLCRQLATSAHCALQHALIPLILCGLLIGGIAVVPSCFYIVMIPLTVDHGIFTRQGNVRDGLLHRWQPITIPCLNSPSSCATHSFTNVCRSSLHA